jgi:predicted phosphoribosyltransferase
MSLLQLWVVVGVPVVFAAIVLLIGGSPKRARIALGLLVGLAVVLATSTNAAGPSIAALGLSDVIVDRLITEARSEIDRRVDTYRHGNELIDAADRVVIIVDDGLATGATAKAAVEVVRQLGAARVVLAIPTGSHQAVDQLTAICDEVICLEIPEWFGSVGSQYESFPQVSDNEVIGLLRD